jgi:putative glutamine amidotransferase
LTGVTPVIRLMRPLIGIPCQGNLRSKYPRFCAGKPYCHALHVAGGAPVLLPLHNEHAALLEMVARLDGLLLSGGGDVAPQLFGEKRLAPLRSVDLPRDEMELWLVRQAVQRNLPTLAICRGIQILNVALGGTLYQDIKSQLPGALRHDFHGDYPRTYKGHALHVKTGNRLGHILGCDALEVNSFHHQCLKEVASALQVTAQAPDGVIEGVELPGSHFVIGVQWHPEELIDVDPRMRGLFEAFVEAARVRSPVS